MSSCPAATSPSASRRIWAATAWKDWTPISSSACAAETSWPWAAISAAAPPANIAVIALSAAGIFFRNAVNLGLPVVLCPEAAAALHEGEEAAVDVDRMAVTQGGGSWRAAPLGDEVRAILAAGGLVPRVRRALAAA